jgi:hypothetical protein
MELNDERIFINDALFLPLILTRLEREQTEIQRTNKILSALLERISGLIKTDLSRAKSELSKRGINVYVEAKDDAGIRYRLKQRGNNESHSLLWREVKAEIDRSITEYITKIQRH